MVHGIVTSARRRRRESDELRIGRADILLRRDRWDRDYFNLLRWRKRRQGRGAENGNKRRSIVRTKKMIAQRKALEQDLLSLQDEVEAARNELAIMREIAMDRIADKILSVIEPRMNYLSEQTAALVGYFSMQERQALEQQQALEKRRRKKR